MRKNPFAGKRAWFPKARFGIFAHFGLYTLVGGNENAVRKGSRKNYARLMQKFNPVRFDADEWVKLARDAGARYIVPTAKHAEGFCLWDSAVTSYKVTNTPFKRDIIAELARACRRRKVVLGLYYNCNAWLEDTLDERTYPDYFEAQLRELMTGYGPIGMVWFDHADPLLPARRVRKTIDMIHALQPAAVVNDRGFGMSRKVRALHGDFITPERFIPDYPFGEHPFIECCDAMGRKSWGYHTEELFWSAPELVRRLSRTASIGGNYLLNVEPGPDGRIRAECVERAEQIGAWLKVHGPAAYDAGACPLVPLDDGTDHLPPIGCATRSGKTVFVHLHRWPSSDAVFLDHIAGSVKSATLLGTRKRLSTRKRARGVLVYGLPPRPPNPYVAVVRLDFRDGPGINTKAIKRARRKTVAVKPGETVYLRPETAQFKAANGVPWPRVNRFPGGKSSVGHLYHYDAQVIWRLKVEKAGRYELFADMGANDLQQGALFTVEIGAHKLVGETVYTGWYDKPTRIGLGKFRLRPGATTAKFKILDMPNGYCADLHALVLQPV